MSAERGSQAIRPRPRRQSGVGRGRLTPRCALGLLAFVALLAAAVLPAGCVVGDLVLGTAVTGVAFDPPQITLAGGEAGRPRVVATLSGGGGREVTDPASGTLYSVEDGGEIVTVDESGAVWATADALTGDSATVSARYRDHRAELRVSVKNHLAATITAGPAGAPLVTNPGGLDVVVNKERNLPADYEPPDLVEPAVAFAGPPRHLRPAAARALEDLFAAAAADGVQLAVVSGYRSYQTQERIFDRNVERYGLARAARFSARPGQSEHQTGLAVDVSGAGVGFRLVQALGDEPEGRWLAEHAPRHGFIIRYPRDEEEVTGYAYEPWHLRYLGRRLAAAVAATGLTLEEYMAE